MPESRFAMAPAAIDMPRSRFKPAADRHLTTFNAGELVPLKVDLDILPGGSYKCRTSFVIRSATPIHPTMDDAYFDLYCFFIPNRLLWSHWEEFCGANKTTYWVQTTQYTVPQVVARANVGFLPKSVADYMRLPTKVGNISVSAFGFRAYSLTYSEWFRDENLISPPSVPTNDTTGTSPATLAGTPATTACYGGDLFKVAKYHDYFTSCLPGPQKSTSTVGIPVQGTAPVLNVDPQGDIYADTVSRFKLYTNPTEDYADLHVSGSVNGSSTGEKVSGSTAGTGEALYTSLQASGGEFTVNVNDLRFSFALQRLYERQALGGSRYFEQLRAIFGVTNPDARLQRPEYLGGGRYKLNMQQVVQSSATGSTGTPQGNTAAYSLTCACEPTFSFSASEFGVLLILGCIRTRHTYQQGIHRMWSRQVFTDYYLPPFANIGNQPVYRKEIYATGLSSDNNTFGFQEAWAEYRYEQNGVSGEFRSNYTTPLDSWHYADYYASAPTLSQAWIEETDVNIARTLAVTSQSQFIADFNFEMEKVLPMPTYSIPGLIDHH